MDPTPTSQRQPSARLVSPDIARGLALWSIAWANMSTTWALVRADVPGAEFGGVIHGGVLDEIVVVASAVFAHVRGLPMFTVLLGFGVGLIALSLNRRGFPLRDAKKVLAKRYAWLAAFGLAHAVFLFFGDIMFTYGIIALILILMIGLKDRTLLIIAGVLWGLLTLVMISAAVFAPADQLSMSVADLVPEFEGYVQYLLFNLAFQLFNVASMPAVALAMLPAMIIGFVAARRGVHLAVERHRRVLWAWVAVAAVVMLGLGVPYGLATLGVLPEEWTGPMGMLNQAFGVLTGPGIAATILLACQPLDRRRKEAAEAHAPTPKLPFPLNMVAALGARSMSGYLAQSVLFVVIALPFTLNIGSELGAFGQLIVVTVVWLLTLVGAWILELRGLPGPFEALHRRLSYGRDGLPVRWQERPENDDAGPQERPGTT